jgi:phosphoglycerate dehydrogenase-like enzyme
MAQQRLVAVSYPVDDEFTRINAEVLDGDAAVAFLPRLGEGERRGILRRAEALIGLNLGRELPPGTWPDAPRLRFVQLLSAGADGIDLPPSPSR